jgi:hypothetical protein
VSLADQLDRSQPDSSATTRHHCTRAGIIEVQWRKPGSPYPFKAAGIDHTAADWYWLEDEPAQADLDELGSWAGSFSCRPLSLGS